MVFLPTAIDYSYMRTWSKINNICDVDKKWIFDSGATDMMTNDVNDIKNIKSTRRTHIQTTNGECVKVEKVGSTEVTSNLELKNCL